MQSSSVALFIFLAVSVGILSSVALTQIGPRKKPAETYTTKESPKVSLNDIDSGMINSPTRDYVFVGGQNGTWFQQGQYPKLYQVSLENDSYTQLSPVRSGGTIWGGGFNGSQLLVSGWGSDDDSPGPYIWLYDGAHVVTEGSLDDYGQASSWSGGDIFSASYNGKEWLVSGLGSGPLPPYSDAATNHMALGSFNGTAFTDLSSLVPNQADQILYTNAWNGKHWLVGGGYLNDGILFSYDGSNVVDLTGQMSSAISNFASVQSIAWNGNYWLIGGIGFLAKYDGYQFTDLTQQLESVLSTSDLYSVNTIAWNGQSWMIGGGAPIAQLSFGHAWVVAYASDDFVNLSPKLPLYVSNQNSSILGITGANGMWILGGYAGERGILLTYNQDFLTDYSNLVSGLTYVDWVSSLQVLEF